MADNQRLRMLAALLSRSQAPSAPQKATRAQAREALANALYKPPQPTSNWLRQPLPMEGRFNILPIMESQPGGGKSVFNERKLALPGFIAGAVNAFTAPGRAMQGQPGFNPEQEGVNMALNFMGGGLGASRMAPAPRGSVGMNAYHGSPHKFDAFDMTKIGTGEGAQAYGHGLYFAEDPKVAGVYQSQVKDMAMIDAANKRMAELARIMEQDQKVGQWRQYKSDAGRRAAQEYDALMEKKLAPGHMYHVDIPDEAVARMLDWDKPFAAQAPEVKAALKSSGLYNEYRANLSNFASPQGSRGSVPRGEYIYNFLVYKYGSAEAASKKLAEIGIPGMRYLDAGSRANNRGTRNLVLFDDKLAKIKKRE